MRCRRLSGRRHNLRLSEAAASGGGVPLSGRGSGLVPLNLLCGSFQHYTNVGSLHPDEVFYYSQENYDFLFKELMKVEIIFC